MSDPAADRRRALDALVEVGRRVDVGRRLDLGSSEAVLRSIVDATVTLFQAEAASLALFDPGSDLLVFRVAAGGQGQGVVGLSVPRDQGLVGYVFTTGQAIALSDVQRDARFGRAFAEQTAYVPRSIVAVPLLDDEGTIGVLEVLDKRDEATFSLRDIELASAFARQATVAIRASRVEREGSALLRAVLAAVLGEGTSDADVDSLAAEAAAALAGDDDSLVWPLVEQVLRVRRADPAQLALVVDILTVLARHAEAASAETARATRAGQRRSGPRRGARSTSAGMDPSEE